VMMDAFSHEVEGVRPGPLELTNQDYQRMRQLTIGDLLLENRTLFLQGPIGDGTANLLSMQMLYLQYENRHQDIHLYVNSPGGSVTATLAIYDTMQFIECDVRTYCMGMAASGAAILVAGGAKGKRKILPHAKMMIHQPYGAVGGQVSDIEIQAKEIIETRQLLNQILAEHTGQPIDIIARDTERDRYLSPQQAKDYGLVDEVVNSKKKLKEPGKSD
jgi:ATP-dependent Clp protease, protease subunit